ncbi:type I restriction endonuclease subunit R [Schaalia suimastitidis]|uniref:type I restriction endonuclease subunit R n=1 Tax=Schaalia suimastitidis TaxID=121163 RepID=UPI00041EFDEC|nr:type I restriction endonuclease subunit R [Schaalia suimastitidis]
MTDASARHYDPIAVSNESTVVAQYECPPASPDHYQSEAELEADFIRILQSQAYEYLPITTEADLITNLRLQLERLNDTEFSDDEWKRYFTHVIAKAGDGIKEKAIRIHEDYIYALKRDDGTIKNIRLIDATHIHNNRLQVINQYEVAQGEGGSRYANRYDVTILVNGLPMVHVELKRRGVEIRQAFNQIKRYQRDSFWAGSGLFDYVQLFVISNGTLTKYYSNTTRSQHLEGLRKAKAKQSSHSFEFTSWWADAANKPIQDLTHFARTFFAKHTLLAILTRYCVLTADRTLMVMRPYQIVATERILQRINTSTNLRQLGTISAGGYVWHTTGSGKTLTSFKTALLASRTEGIDKVLFVVDRKDLDYQTMREYDRFEKGAANSNASTAILKSQLEDPTKRIIITTIQKLSNFVAGNKNHPVFGQHVVIIFDECHRSQFGDMHAAITKSFKKYHIFGFTGTPIFADNSGGGRPGMRTTEQLFGDKLHTYTIVDAITDRNVLPFRIDYINTMKTGTVEDQQVHGIDTETAFLHPEHIRQVTAYILQHFDQKTKRSSSYEHKVVTNIEENIRPKKDTRENTERRRVRGFNAIFATASIDAAKRYYNQFALQQRDLPEAQRLKVALIYSYGANEDLDAAGLLPEENFDALALEPDSRNFLEDAISDYNALFGTSYDTSGDGFHNYYKDLSMRLKNREVDLVIVVNMFLTGFDATTLNTLFVDKNLRAHGLIQAYSRTNRILNSVKTYGNIVCFRNLEDATNQALELFGNKDARSVVLLKPYSEYYAEYLDLVDQLRATVTPGERIVGESAERDFIVLFGKILRLNNILTSFDEFAYAAKLGPGEFEDYKGIYNDLREEYTVRTNADKASIAENLVFEIELIKQVEVNVDFILMLVENYRKTHGNGEDKEIRAQISRALRASPTLRDKRDLVEEFVDSVSITGDLHDQWQAFIAHRQEAELSAIVTEENLNVEEIGAFIARAFREGEIPSTGTMINKVLPPMNYFTPDAARAQMKQRVVERLSAFLNRFMGLGSH